MEPEATALKLHRNSRTWVAWTAGQVEERKAQ